MIERDPYGDGVPMSIAETLCWQHLVHCADVMQVLDHGYVNLVEALGSAVQIRGPLASCRRTMLTRHLHRWRMRLWRELPKHSA